MFSSLAFLLIFLLLVVLVLGTMAVGGILAAPWVPIRSRDVDRLLKLADLKPGMKLYDLGCGDGRIIISAAKKYHTNSIGFEVAALPFLITYFKIITGRLWSKVQVKYANFYKQDLSQADVICAFLSPRAMKKLSIKLKKEKKKDMLLVSYVFKVLDWQPETVDKPNKNDLPIFVYKI